MCVTDADSSGNAVTVEFEPRLRASPANNAAIIVDDGVLGAPTCVMLLREPTVGWTSRPMSNTSELSSLTITMIEDLFVTQ